MSGVASKRATCSISSMFRGLESSRLSGSSAAGIDAMMEADFASRVVTASVSAQESVVAVLSAKAGFGNGRRLTVIS